MGRTWGSRTPRAIGERALSEETSCAAFDATPSSFPDGGRDLTENMRDMETKRFTTRIEYLEEPRVADQLQREAIRSATSVAAVIRQAVRRQLEAKRG